MPLVQACITSQFLGSAGALCLPPRLASGWCLGTALLSLSHHSSRFCASPCPWFPAPSSIINLQLFINLFHHSLPFIIAIAIALHAHNISWGFSRVDSQRLYALSSHIRALKAQRERGAGTGHHILLPIMITPSQSSNRGL